MFFYTLYSQQKMEHDEEIALVEKTKYASHMAELEEQLRRAQLKFDMKQALDERRKASGLNKKKKKKKNKNEDDDDDDDEEEEEEIEAGIKEGEEGIEGTEVKAEEGEHVRTVEEELAHIQSLMSSARGAWNSAEIKFQNFHGLALANRKKIQNKKMKQKELIMEISRNSTLRETIESQDTTLNVAKSQLLQLVSEEASLWHDISIEETSIEIIDVEVAEQVQKEKEEKEKKEALRLAKESGAEVEIEIITLADGTTQQIIRVIEKKDRDFGCQTDPVAFGNNSNSNSNSNNVSSSSNNNNNSQAGELLRIVKEELTDTSNKYATLRRKTAEELEKMGYDLSKFARGLGKQLGMKLEVKEVAISKEGT